VAGVGALTFFQCCDAVGWITGRSFRLRITCVICPVASLPEHVEECHDVHVAKGYLENGC